MMNHVTSLADEGVRRSVISNRRVVGRDFWIRWVIASGAGSGAGVLLWVAIGGVMEAIGIDGQDAMPVAFQAVIVGAAFGTPFGIAQWLALRRQVERAGKWVLATALGYAAVFLLGALLIPGGDAANLAPVLQVALGALLGALVTVPVSGLQWLLVLRSQVPQAALWIPASAASWAIGFAISFALRLWLGELTFVAGPVVAIGLSGLVMVQLLRRAHALPEVTR